MGCSVFSSSSISSDHGVEVAVHSGLLLVMTSLGLRVRDCSSLGTIVIGGSKSDCLVIKLKLLYGDSVDRACPKTATDGYILRVAWACVVWYDTIKYATIPTIKLDETIAT